MADKDDALDGARQMGPTSQWDKTPAQVAAEYSATAKGQRARPAIERAALELTKRYSSRSEFRDHDGPIDNLGGLVANVDGRVHELWTLWLAVELKHEPAIALLKAKAQAGSALARAALGRIGE
ncbi:hypothetical protein SEA_LILBEANIE_39 [Gordonia phage Lilbeanie]|uniref:Uncharacterized protein n=1 Tax=Gordonia phage Lilbeanie TaxID=2794947 RepID=A0A7T1NXQ5_9CAUD|nr:hypothetical protein J1773_gp39 [Gordonia phage Lilbeanie]QPO17117.1 hypothetical protein SEA_LILBEANIE_39 [Gordonia phage Lilbeanie]